MHTSLLTVLHDGLEMVLVTALNTNRCIKGTARQKNKGNGGQKDIPTSCIKGTVARDFWSGFFHESAGLGV